MPKIISENIEEYLETLYKMGSRDSYVSTTTLSKELNIAPGSVTQMLKKLEILGYIDYVPYKGASLTNEGNKVAQKITRKHRILERFLKDVLVIKEENIHNQACDMEHSLSDEAERAICHMLKHPDTCPDNNIIPACDFDFRNCFECMDSEIDVEKMDIREYNLLSISQLTDGERGEILFVRGDYISSLEFDSNLCIGDKIKVISSNDDFTTILVNDSLLEISHDLSNNIFVKII